MEEYGIMELFRADSNQMRAVDGKRRIYLEWPYLNPGNLYSVLHLSINDF